MCHLVFSVVWTEGVNNEEGICKTKSVSELSV